MSGETAEIVALDPSHDPVNEVAGPEFPLALRGYDRSSVDAYVARVTELVAELHAVSSPRAAVRRALDRVGAQTTAILQEAQRAADELTARSRARADERVEQGEREAARLVAAAAKRLQELDEGTEALWRERMKLIDDTRALADRLQGIAAEATAAFPPEPAPAEPAVEEEPEPTAALPPGAGEEAVSAANGPPTQTFEAEAAIAGEEPAEDEAAAAEPGETPTEEAAEPVEGQERERA